jgi:hypothetical protein
VKCPPLDGNTEDRPHASASACSFTSRLTSTVLAHRPGQPPRILTETDTLDGEDVVPGFSLPVREIFA